LQFRNFVPDERTQEQLMTNLAAGQVLGRYRVIAPLGRGGMAAVYRAEETSLGREVALKVLPAELMEQSGFLERFEREAQVIAQLEHPNIVPLYASGIDEGIPWMALRLLAHGTLQERLEAGELGIDEGLQLFSQVARALDHAHAQGVLHRDLKPQNVLLGSDGSAYLADFGIARILSGGSNLTVTGMMLGTPSYMAPEQAQGTVLGPACDYYALAVMLYRWLCGKVPFDADTPLAVMMKHVQAPVPLEPMDSLPPEVREVLLTGLAKNPKQRWPSASAMVQALGQALGSGATRIAVHPERSAMGVPPVAAASSSDGSGRVRKLSLIALPVLLVGMVVAVIQFWPAENEGVGEALVAPIRDDWRDVAAADRTDIDEDVLSDGIATLGEPELVVEASPVPEVSGDEDVAATDEPPAAQASSGMVDTPSVSESADAASRPAEETESATTSLASDPASNSVELAEPPSISTTVDTAPTPFDPDEERPVPSGREPSERTVARSTPPAPGTVFRDCPQCPEMVVIPAGRFVMGSPADEPQRKRTEGPQREVSIQSFALAKFETRFDEWDTCLAEGGCSHRPSDKGWGGSAQPVIHVSWNDAQEYLAWLSAHTGERYRLPSEAEWEYAARAGTTGRHYQGDCLTSDLANFNAHWPAHGCPRGEYRRRAVEVGRFPANPYGLHDMHGNVWEWVQDCANNNYRDAPVDGSAWMRGNCNRGTVRGGAWHDWGFWLRAAARYSFPRDSRHAVGGFRVVRELP
jgi:serine/threonine-protein kinase PpkA